MLATKKIVTVAATDSNDQVHINCKVAWLGHPPPNITITTNFTHWKIALFEDYLWITLMEMSKGKDLIEDSFSKDIKVQLQFSKCRRRSMKSIKKNLCYVFDKCPEKKLTESLIRFHYHTNLMPLICNKWNSLSWWRGLWEQRREREMRRQGRGGSWSITQSAALHGAPSPPSLAVSVSEEERRSCSLVLTARHAINGHNLISHYHHQWLLACRAAGNSFRQAAVRGWGVLLEFKVTWEELRPQRSKMHKRREKFISCS